MNEIPNELDADEPLIEIELNGTGRELTEDARRLIDRGRSLFKSVNVFEFVPSNYEMVWDKLDALPRGTFCELGSGFGIATGLAEMLGFDAMGVEISPELVEISRGLLLSFGLRIPIVCGDYLQRRDVADVYFTYAWPSQMRSIEQRFTEIASRDAKLLICHGQDDLRCKILRPPVD